VNLSSRVGVYMAPRGRCANLFGLVVFLVGDGNAVDSDAHQGDIDMKENRDVSLRDPARPFARVPRSAPATGPGPAEGEPRIAAFIWGGKTRPTPTLPYGRWKGAA
jgi:hypothetical protein